MEKMIKEIRLQLQMSQEEFAKKLKVSFGTVNRWENGHVLPNTLAQSKLYELCKEKDISVYQMVLKRIAREASKIKLEGNRVLLYHGSKSGIKGAIEPKSRARCDFGKGFYMGTEPGQALTLICDYEKSKFYIVSLDMNGLDTLDISVGMDWAMMVAFHRGKMESVKGTSFYENYREKTKQKDLIIGNIANDRMFYVIDNFFLGNITDKALTISLSALQLGKQYVAVSQKGCGAVEIECEIELSHMERQFLKDEAEQNRVKGISLANEICKNYRREGLFFDEILENIKTGGREWMDYN